MPADKNEMSALKKLLVLEDDKEMCEELLEILKEEGFSVDAVFDGYSADEIIEKNEYGAYLLDVKVPGINGLELLKEIKKKRPQAKVVVISANPMLSVFLEDGSGNDEELKTLKLADGVISKPFQIEKLLETLHKLFTL